MFTTTCAITPSLSEPAWVGDRHTDVHLLGVHLLVASLQGQLGFQGQCLPLGVNPSGCLGPNPYHPSPKVTSIPLDQISTPFLWNICSVASYQFVPKPLTNSYNHDLPPL